MQLFSLTLEMEAPTSVGCNTYIIAVLIIVTVHLLIVILFSLYMFIDRRVKWFTGLYEDPGIQTNGQSGSKTKIFPAPTPAVSGRATVSTTAQTATWRRPAPTPSPDIPITHQYEEVDVRGEMRPLPLGILKTPGTLV